jgi:hypothetical protein
MDIIPGCESLDYIGEGEYTGKIQLGLTGISGSYNTRILIGESDPPRYCKYEGEVNVKSGLISGDAKIYLSADEDRCLIDYQANGLIKMDRKISTAHYRIRY